MADVGHIDATACDICCHKHLKGAVAEASERLLTRALALVAVNGERFDAILAELLDDAIAAMLGTAEHQHLAGLLIADDVSEQTALVILHDPHH